MHLHLQADHPTQVPEWHAAVLNIYRKQVIATRYLQQQKLLQQGGAAAAAALAMLKGLQDDEVLPSQFINDGYVWLAMTHHLMGAGLTDQVRGLAVDLLHPVLLDMLSQLYPIQFGSFTISRSASKYLQLYCCCTWQYEHLLSAASALSLGKPHKFAYCLTQRRCLFRRSEHCWWTRHGWRSSCTAMV